MAGDTFNSLSQVKEANLKMLHTVQSTFQKKKKNTMQSLNIVIILNGSSNELTAQRTFTPLELSCRVLGWQNV